MPNPVDHATGGVRMRLGSTISCLIQYRYHFLIFIFRLAEIWTIWYHSRRSLTYKWFHSVHQERQQNLLHLLEKLWHLLEFQSFCSGEGGRRPNTGIAYAMVRWLELAKPAQFQVQCNLSERLWARMCCFARAGGLKFQALESEKIDWSRWHGSHNIFGGFCFKAWIVCVLSWLGLVGSLQYSYGFRIWIDLYEPSCITFLAEFPCHQCQ